MTEVFDATSTIEQWDKDYYHPIALRFYDWAVSDMLKMMEVEAQSTVLDAGCGPGVHAIRVAKAGHNVCAIDLSKAMLEQAQQRVEAEKMLDNIQFYQKDLTQLDFPDSSFHYVFSWGVIIHIPEVEKALDELARIVKPKGKLALYITNQSAVDHKLESFLRFLLRKPINFQRFPLGDGIWYEMNAQKLWVWRFNTKAVTDYLLAKGFTLKYHRIGELSEIQRRLNGLPRHLLLRLNNLAYRLKFPQSLATTNILIFEKNS